MENKVKAICGIIMVFGGIIAAIGCVIASIIFAFQNPDMTELRRFLEYPGPSIIALISLAVMKIGVNMIKSYEE
jgi:hypothetical protein